MKKLIFNQKKNCALFGLFLALTVVTSSNGQQAGLLLSKQEIKVTSKNEYILEEVKKVDRDEPAALEIDIALEEIPSVTFINKMGEIVAVLYGDKSVLKEMYSDKISRSYFVSAYGKHEIYLIK